MIGGPAIQYAMLVLQITSRLKFLEVVGISFTLLLLLADQFFPLIV
jgi:hypothetical protein